MLARPGIERFEGKELVFRDGSRERADVVLYATGYHLRYPYLPAELVDTRGDDLTLFLGAMHPRRHDLFIVGVSRPTGAFWPIAEVQARFAAALLSGRYALPRQAEIERRSQPILRRRAFNPALYGLAVREELRPRRAPRGADRRITPFAADPPTSEGRSSMVKKPIRNVVPDRLDLRDRRYLPAIHVPPPRALKPASRAARARPGRHQRVHGLRARRRSRTACCAGTGVRSEPQRLAVHAVLDGAALRRVPRIDRATRARACAAR